MKIKKLISKREISIRFNEADPMGVVWHGHYIQYFEDGREAFGDEFGIGYNEVHLHGFSIPVVSINCQYKQPLKYGDKAIVEVTYIDSSVAKIEFEYAIYRSSDKVLVATGKSTQVFLNREGELQLILPAFVYEWKVKNNLV